MGSQRESLEEAVATRLISRFGRGIEGAPRDGYLRRVAPYNGQLDSAQGPDDLRTALRGLSPAVLVSAANASVVSQSTARRNYKRRIQLELYLISNHLRERTARTQSDVVAESDVTADPGIYQMVEDIELALATEDLGLDGVGHIAPQREEILLQLPDFTVWRLTFAVDVDASIPAWDADGPLLLSYHIDGNLIEEPSVLATPPNPFTEATTVL